MIEMRINNKKIVKILKYLILILRITHLIIKLVVGEFPC